MIVQIVYDNVVTLYFYSGKHFELTLSKTDLTCFPSASTIFYVGEDKEKYFINIEHVGYCKVIPKSKVIPK